MNLAECLKQARRDRGLSQADVADKLNIARQSISKWETGRTLPDLENLIRLSDLFNLSLDDLIKGDVSMRDKISRDRQQYIFAKIFMTIFIAALVLTAIIYASFAATTPPLEARFMGYLPWLIMLVIPCICLGWLGWHYYPHFSRRSKVVLIVGLAGTIAGIMMLLISAVIYTISF